MINVSNAFKTAIKEKSRQFAVQLVVDGNVLACDIDNIKCYKGSCGSELSLGSVYASYIEGTLKKCNTALMNKDITYKVGLLVNGAYEYVTMGTYKVLEYKESNGTVTFMAVSTLSMKGNTSYTSESLGPSKNISQVLSDVASKMGVSSSVKGFNLPSDYITGDIIKGSTREVLGLLGCLTGGFITEDNSGNIVLAKYNSGETLSVQPYQSINLPEYSTPYLITGIHVTVKEATGSTPEEYFEYGTPVIIQTCDRMTQSLFDAMYPNIVGTRFDLAKLEMALGDPRIEPWDVMAVTDLKGNVHNVPCFEIVHTFNGGFLTEINAQVQSTDQSTKNVKGAMSKAVERLDADVMAAAVAADDAKAKATLAAEVLEGMEEAAEAAHTTLNGIYADAESAKETLAEMEDAAEAANTTLTGIYQVAKDAEYQAGQARDSARNANTYANAALDQLGVVEDVIGVLTWAAEHGSFFVTSDTTVQEGKVYYTYDVTEQDYTPVIDPTGNPHNKGYYELRVDEAMEAFIMAHLAVTSRGLWVLPNGLPSDNQTIDNTVDKNSSSDTQAQKQANANARQADKYKVLLSNDGMYVYDGAGVMVSKYGESITFNSTRPQYIGNNSTYISFNPNNGGSLTINGATINITTNKTLDEVLDEKLDAVDVSVTQTSTGANITVNGDTVSVSNGERGGKILKVTTAPTAYTTTIGTFTPAYRISKSTVLSQSGSSDVIEGDVLAYSYYNYPVGYVDASYVYTTARTSIRGATGTAGKWYTGTAITGTSTTATIFSDSGISSAVVGDMYLNTDTGNTYRCTTAGAPTAAKWVYTTDITGPQGDQGVSVTSSTPYYKLATTTPTKPENNTQPTGWSLTQPALDTTQNCYVVVQTIFSTGNITYSDVSTLSEYEASKTAYALADQADGKADANAQSITTLIGRVNDVDTIIRESADGVLTAKVGNAVGTLVNADGSFDVVLLAWSNSTPTVQNTLASYSSTGAVIYNQSNKPIAQYGETAIIGDPSSFHIEASDTEMGLYEGDTKVAYVNNDRLYIPQAAATNEVCIGNKWTWKFDDNDDSLYLKWI